MTAVLELVPWIAAGVMFGAFVIEGVASLVVLRDGHHDLCDSLVNVATTIGYVLARVGLGAAIAIAFVATWDLTPLRWSMDAWWHWAVLFVASDFSYYWSHRASHVYRVMWASHAVHHSSPKLNLSTGLRNSWIGGAIDWVFAIPVIALGFHPLHLAAVVAVASAWDFLTHTPYVGKIPLFDLVFNTPSNHRVHHAKNPRYLDKNLGGALIVWDRLFGTYAAEDEAPVYGALEMPRRPHDPFYLQVYLWGALLRDAGRGRRAAPTRPTSA